LEDLRQVSEFPVFPLRWVPKLSESNNNQLIKFEIKEMESLNLTLKADSKDDGLKRFLVKISDTGEIEMSKEEMLQIIESQRKEIRYLN
jgi:hypothetical protein